MKRFLLTAAGTLALAFALHAAPVERDLGNGLIYVRVYELPADLPAKPAAGRAPACIVDLRFVLAESEAAVAFQAWLKLRALPRSPVFVLANRDTSPALRTVLSEQSRPAGIVTIGIPSEGFRPDVASRASAEDERRAYQALEQGTPLVKLLADNPDKVRNDEASLNKDRLADAVAEAADDLLTGKRAPPPIDTTLQRAVHLHRALLALKRI